MKPSFLAPVTATISAALTLSIPNTAFAQSLKVGDTAPALTVGKWVKGTPVKSLSDGKVHVVEFWATWCVPCKASIPHLTELAQKFKGKADFTGVSVWEQDQKLIAPFVAQMGSKMTYSVAMDKVPPGGKGDDGAMAKNWMTASGQDGIPTAFVVDKTGKIAWIGHPMNNLEAVITKVIAGTLDVKGEAALAAAKKAKTDASFKWAMEIMAIAEAGKTGEALAAYAKMKQDDPDFGPAFGAHGLLTALLAHAPQAAKTLAQELRENEMKGDAETLNEMAWAMVAPDSTAKEPDYAFAVSLAEQAAAASKTPTPAILDTLALAYFKSGDKAKAIVTAEKAVALLEADPNADAAMKKEVSERLAGFKRG